MNEQLLNSNQKQVRVNHTVYTIISHKLGKRVLAQAEPIKGEIINLITGRSPLVKAIRTCIKHNLFV